MNDELWMAKANLISSFARGPGIMIADEDERMARLSSIIATLEVEFESRVEKVVGITAAPRDLDTGHRTEWETIVVDLRRHPNKEHRAHYTRYGTATSSVSKLRGRYDDIEFFAEVGKDGSGFVVAAKKP